MESSVARRARWRADDRLPHRTEPRLAPGHHSQDADILDVVQKFELVYSQFNADQRETGREAGLAEAAAAAFSTRETSPQRDTAEPRSDTIEASMRRGTTAIQAAPHPAVEKFELPEESVLEVTERRSVVSDWPQPERKPRRLWPKVLSAAALALVIGIAVGYLMVPRAESPSARAKIESSTMGGTRLRVDYELRSVRALPE
ncbi:MAG: hypothetical protein ACXWCY_25735 [Burkholderiales bacterium]